VEAMLAAKSKAVLQIKITLEGVQPSIWRRVQVLSDCTLGQLHRVIQAVMGWEDYHLHEFIFKRKVYAIPDPDDDLYERKVTDERQVRLSVLVPRVGMRFQYHYDFGDNWRHDLLLESISISDPGSQYPVCVAGARNCPPEDCGGYHGYAGFLEAIRDPEHKEHERVLEWIGGHFDPEFFDLDQVNQALRKRIRSRKG
jgi:hypothetical protein